MAIVEAKVQPPVKRLAFEAIVRGIGIEENSALANELKELYDLKHPALEYTPATFQDFVKLVCQRLFPQLSYEAALFELGRFLFHGFYKGTTVGGIMFSALRIMSQYRLAKLSERIWEDMGIGQFEVQKNGSGKLYSRCRNFIVEPSLLIGAAFEGMMAAGAKRVNYTVERQIPYGPEGYNFNILFEFE